MSARKQNVLRDFVKLAAEKKVPFYQNIHDLMSALGSPFPTPPDPYDYKTGQADISALQSAVQTALSRAKGTADAVKLAAETADTMVMGWADYTDIVAQNNPTVIVAAGFDATSGETHPLEIPGQVNTLDYVPQKEAGSVLFTQHTMGRGVNFTIIVGTDLSTLVRNGAFVTNSNPAIQLYILTTTHTELLVTGLPAKTAFQAVCYASNTAGNGAMSATLNFSTP